MGWPSLSPFYFKSQSKTGLRPRRRDRPRGAGPGLDGKLSRSLFARRANTKTEGLRADDVDSQRGKTTSCSRYCIGPQWGKDRYVYALICPDLAVYSAHRQNSCKEGYFWANLGGDYTPHRAAARSASGNQRSSRPH